MSDWCCGWKGILTGVIIFIGLLLTIVLVSLSLKTVDFDEVAIEYNKVTRSIGDEVLGEGLHDVGPAGSLIKLKTTQREGSMRRLTALTSDSIEISLDVDVFYSIDRKAARDIIEKHGNQEAHDDFIVAFCAAVVRDTASDFTAKQFYLQRQDFQIAVQTTLRTKFSAADAGATVDTVQVLDITLPRTVINAMEASTVAEQDIQNAIAERTTLLQAASIRYDLARSEAELVIIEANRDEALIEQAAEQDVLIERQKMTSRTDAFRNVSTAFGLGGDFFVNSYLKYLVAKSNLGATLVGV